MHHSAILRTESNDLAERNSASTKQVQCQGKMKNKQIKEEEEKPAKKSMLNLSESPAYASYSWP